MEMKPGRELDALIAEKVMGMNVQHGRVWSQEGKCLRETDLPSYSTDIAAAWEVVEKLKLGLLPDGDKWIAGQADRAGLETSNLCWGDTAPHAICLAALNAVSQNPS